VLPTDTRIGSVNLRVASIGNALDFYGGILGLHVMQASAGTASVGAPNATRPLIQLVEHPGARRQPVRASGLYHTAFLLPRRTDLGLVLRHLADVRWPLQGGSDHAVSEALYLADADGNGVEIYADRPRGSWPRDGNEIAMTTIALDVEDLLRQSDESGELWSGMPEGTTVGHVHLRVPSVEMARELFVDIIGLDVTAANYPGALFMSAGGYHHHVAANIWEGRGVPPLPENAAGLLDFEILITDAAAINRIADRATTDLAVAAGITVDRSGDNGDLLALTHQSGIRVLLCNTNKSS
jgi:catechol 2,3-dioxygenase